MKITASTKEQAWAIVSAMFPTDYEKDCQASRGAGYDIYRHRELNPNNWISDLETCLEVNINGITTNIWIDPPNEQPKEKTYSNQEYYIKKEYEIVQKLLKISEQTNQIKLGFGWTSKNGFCNKGIVIYDCAAFVISELKKIDGVSLEMNDGALLIRVMDISF